MLSLICYPGLNAADAYMSMAVDILARLPSLTSVPFPVPNMDGLSTIADMTLEKAGACCFHSVFVAELGRSASCAECTGTKTDGVGIAERERLFRRKKVDHSSSPMPLIAVLAARWDEHEIAAIPPLPSAEPPEQVVTELESLIVPSSEPRRDSISSSQKSRGSLQPLPFPNVEVEIKPHPGSYVGFPQRIRKEGEKRILTSLNRTPPINALTPSSQKTSSRSESQLQTAKDMYVLAGSFEETLEKNFGCVEYAFDYMDSATGPRRGKVSMTKFLYCCEMLGVADDARALFSFLDTKSDGELDLEELKGWKPIRTEHIRRIERASFTAGSN